MDDQYSRHAAQTETVSLLTFVGAELKIPERLDKLFP